MEKNGVNKRLGKKSGGGKSSNNKLYT